MLKRKTDNGAVCMIGEIKKIASIIKQHGKKLLLIVMEKFFFLNKIINVPKITMIGNS